VVDVNADTILWAEWTHAFDARDPCDEGGHSLYRCPRCKALVCSLDLEDHQRWHEVNLARGQWR
jgi:uncharacterized C2H2 Zn-finger protein